MPKINVPPSNSFTATVKGIIPAAGLGSRMASVSLAVAKELLPVRRKPMLQWALEEACHAGLKEIIIVIRKGKESIRNFFDAVRKTSIEDFQRFKQCLSDLRMEFVYQNAPLGLGNALISCRKFIGKSPFAMIIPDQLFFGDRTATAQLLDAAAKNPESVWSSIIHIPDSELKFFPGARTFKLFRCTDTVWEVKDINGNNPKPDGPCRIGFGRTYFPVGAVDYFSSDYLNPRSGEVDLLPSFKALIRDFPNYAVLLNGRAMDFGTWPAYEYFSSRVQDLPGEINRFK